MLFTLPLCQEPETWRAYVEDTVKDLGATNITFFGDSEDDLPAVAEGFVISTADNIIVVFRGCDLVSAQVRWIVIRHQVP